MLISLFITFSLSVSLWNILFSNVTYNITDCNEEILAIKLISLKSRLISNWLSNYWDIISILVG